MKHIILTFIATLALYGVGEGDQAPDFTLSSLDGTSTDSLKAHRGEVVLLNLWASWCKGCKKEMPEFVALQKSYKKGFKLITVNLDNSPPKAQKFLHHIENKTGSKIPFVTLIDPTKRVAKAYQCAALPSSYLIDKNGMIKQVTIGSLDTDDIQLLKKEINALK